MDQNVNFLGTIYQNAEMGVETITQLLGIVDDPAFGQHLRDQLMEYQSIQTSAKEKLQAVNCSEHPINPLQKVATHLSINMSTLTDKTPSHIAEMMMQGSTMGIIDATKNIKKYAGARDDIMQLANRLLRMEEQNVEQLQKYLQ